VKAVLGQLDRGQVKVIAEDRTITISESDWNGAWRGQANGFSAVTAGTDE
jgi:hypothetical protein